MFIFFFFFAKICLLLLFAFNFYYLKPIQFYPLFLSVQQVTWSLYRETELPEGSKIGTKTQVLGYLKNFIQVYLEHVHFTNFLFIYLITLEYNTVVY